MADSIGCGVIWYDGGCVDQLMWPRSAPRTDDVFAH